MTWFNKNRTNGFVHDYETALNLSEERAVFFCLSERSAYLLQNLTELDIGMYHRYATAWNKNLYQPVQADTAESANIDLWMTNAQKETMQMTCEDFNFTIQVSGGGCGCQPAGQDTLKPPPAMSEFTAPPPGWEAMTGGDADKCKMAYLLRDQIQAIWGQLDAFGVDTITGAGLSVGQALLASVLLQISWGPIGWAMTTLGAVSALVGAMVDLSVDLAFMEQVTIDRAADIICAFYTAGDPQEAEDDLVVIYEEEGAGATEIVYLKALFVVRAAALLFYLPEQDDTDWQAMLDGLPAQDCEACGGAAPGAFRYALKQGVPMGTGQFTYDNNPFTLTAVVNPDTGYYRLQALARDPDGLGGWINCTNWDVVFISSTITDPEPGFARGGNCRQGGTPGLCDGNYPASYGYQGGQPPAQTHLNTQQFLWTSEFPFTVTFRIEGIDAGPCP